MTCVPESFDPNAVPLHKIILSLNIPFLRSIIEPILQESYLTKDVQPCDNNQQLNESIYHEILNKYKSILDFKFQKLSKHYNFLVSGNVQYKKHFFSQLTIVRYMAYKALYHETFMKRHNNCLLEFQVLYITSSYKWGHSVRELERFHSHRQLVNTG